MENECSRLIIENFSKRNINKYGEEQTILLHFESEMDWYKATVWASKDTNNREIVELGYIEFYIKDTNWKDSQFFGIDGILVNIEDISVNEEFRRDGIGKILIECVINDVVNLYTQKTNKEKKNIFLVGELSEFDYYDGNWNQSIPFYMNLAHRIAQEYPIYKQSRGIIGVDLNQEYEEFIYDSNNKETLKRYGDITQTQYIKELIQELKEEAVDGLENAFILFHFEINE